MADKDKKGSGVKQIIVMLNKQSEEFKKINERLDSIEDANRTQFVDSCNRFDQLETKIAAVAKGRGTTTRKPTTTTAGDSPKGPKTYVNSMYYFKGEYARDPDAMKKKYCTVEILDALKEYCDTDEKIKKLNGERRLKAEATYIWTTFIKKFKGASKEDDAEKVELRELVKNDFNAYMSNINKANNTPAEKDDDDE